MTAVVERSIRETRLMGREVLAERFRLVRDQTLRLAAPLSAEDQQVQSMPDASPTKWHIGHTSWFFDAMLLQPRGERIGDGHFHYLFNSYYEALGSRQPRPLRGLITRPSLAEIIVYRRRVDEAVLRLMEQADETAWLSMAPLLELGLHHEQQHQELILMDIKHLLFCNPAHPAYDASAAGLEDAGAEAAGAGSSGWEELPAGLVHIGAEATDFAYDNERPRHKVWCEASRLRRDLVRCGEWQAFMADGGYERPEFWLSDGWERAQAEGWRAPLYWSEKEKGQWRIFTLQGERPLDPEEPVCHVSYYEADAFARWAGCRLPTEVEWERAAWRCEISDGFALHPATPSDRDLNQMTGAVWQWTASAYAPYPGFAPERGAIGEYNGKFMSGQMVLRGGACITPPGHTRPTYRNFFPPAARWAFSGVRLAHES